MQSYDFRSYLPALETAIARSFLAVAPNTPLTDALALMNQSSSNSSQCRYSCVLVMERSRLVGLLTERDIVRLTAENKPLVGVSISDIMTRQLVTLAITQSQDVSTALQLMRQYRIRHLPIVDEQGQLIGIVTPDSIRQSLQPCNLLRLRRIEEVMVTQVIHAPPTASVLSLSQLMAQHRVSCVAIAQQEIDSDIITPIGIVTERDIVQFRVMELDLTNTKAQSIMSAPLVCVSPNDSLWAVQQQMQRLRVRRLVVTGDRNELLGIVTQTSMLQALDITEAYGVIKTLQQEVEKQTTQLQQVNQRLHNEIVERQNIADLLFQEKELAQITLQSIGDAVITTDAKGNIEYFNPVAEQLTGWQVSEVKGLPLSEFFNIANEVTKQPIENSVDRVLQNGLIANIASHALLLARDGTQYAIDKSVAPIRDRNGQIVGAVLIFRDVTEARKLEKRLSWQATHDLLTSLVNRHEFERHLQKAIATAKMDDRQHALLYLDLDRFKVVNDTCGHAAGDELLRQVTRLLHKRVRTTDILARLGGDEFGLLLYQCSLLQAKQMAEILGNLIQSYRFAWEGKIFAIGVSIGVVTIDADSQDLNKVISAADSACYQAKENGRNCYFVYRSGDRKSEKSWRVRLERALLENRFCLYCQKIVPLHSGLTTEHSEILLRLADETGKLVLPMAFLPEAERYNLMPAIDCWVIGTFFSNYERASRGNPDRVYSINISVASINSSQSIEFIKEQLIRYRVCPSNICFEIAEVAAIANLERVAYFADSLKQLGCRFALDDFGTGMSSFAYTKNIPIDYVKIDGSLTKHIASDRVDCAIVESLNQIARARNIQTIAKAIEDRATLEKLKEIGLDYAQGDEIGCPCPLSV